MHFNNKTKIEKFDHQYEISRLSHRIVPATYVPFCRDDEQLWLGYLLVKVVIFRGVSYLANRRACDNMLQDLPMPAMVRVFLSSESFVSPLQKQNYNQETVKVPSE